jgi:glucosyl-dolichyl phosphate glucuronosyltransferase
MFLITYSILTTRKCTCTSDPGRFHVAEAGAQLASEIAEAQPARLAQMNASIVIATVNRAAELRGTLESLAKVRPPGPVELIVVDNRSRDETADVVAEAASSYPFPIRYLFEPEPGKYAALNAGIRAARGRIIAATDDDARFEGDWLEQALDGLDRQSCDFVGGRVMPIWGASKPAWLSEHSSLHAKVVALLDHGSSIREFGQNISWPLGVNVAYRREVFDRVGLFDNRLGRKTGTLRNQAQREWHLRARSAGVRGFYLPGMVVHHLVAAARLDKKYFRRWQYWHGISRAILFRLWGFDLEEPELVAPPHAAERRICGVPAHLFSKAVHSAGALAWHTLRGEPAKAFEHELWLCFFAGVVRQRWADRSLPVADGPATVRAFLESAITPNTLEAERVDLVM